MNSKSPKTGAQLVAAGVRDVLRWSYDDDGALLQPPVSISASSVSQACEGEDGWVTAVGSTATYYGLIKFVNSAEERAGRVFPPHRSVGALDDWSQIQSENPAADVKEAPVPAQTEKHPCECHICHQGYDPEIHSVRCPHGPRKEIVDGRLKFPRAETLIEAMTTTLATPEDFRNGVLPPSQQYLNNLVAEEAMKLIMNPDGSDTLKCPECEFTFSPADGDLTNGDPCPACSEVAPDTGKFVGGGNPLHPVRLRPPGTTDQALELNAWLEFQDLQSSLDVNAGVYRGHPEGGIYHTTELFDSSKPGYGQIPNTPEFFPPPFPPIDPDCLKAGDSIADQIDEKIAAQFEKEYCWHLLVPACDMRVNAENCGKTIHLTMNLSGANALRKFAAAHKAEILATLYGHGTPVEEVKMTVNNNVERESYVGGGYRIKQSVGGVQVEVTAEIAWEAQAMFDRLTQEPGYSPGDKLVDTSAGVAIPPPNPEGNNLEAIEEALKGQDVTYDQHSCPEGYAAKVLETVRNRGADYGTPAENHQLTADLLTSFFSRKSGLPITISAEDVCLINILQKIARLAHHSKDDNYLDIAGYAENVAMLRKDQRKRG